MLHSFTLHYFRLHAINQCPYNRSFHHLIPFAMGWLRHREDRSFKATHWTFTSEVNYSVGHCTETGCWKKKKKKGGMLCYDGWTFEPSASSVLFLSLDANSVCHFVVAWRLNLCAWTFTELFSLALTAPTRFSLPQSPQAIPTRTQVTKLSPVPKTTGKQWNNGAHTY